MRQPDYSAQAWLAAFSIAVIAACTLVGTGVFLSDRNDAQRALDQFQREMRKIQKQLDSPGKK